MLLGAVRVDKTNNCLIEFNAEQRDDDTHGDGCDDDGDRVLNAFDNCLTISNVNQLDH